MISQGNYVLITGASGGLGLEFARVFAQHGYNLVVVARSEDKLYRLKKQLEGAYDIHVTVIPSDLSIRGEAEHLYKQVQEQGLVIDQLINNAGVGKESRVIECDTKILQDIITLNIESMTILCKLFGHDMVERGRGNILNISSLGAFIPDPYFNVYGPSKAYELFLTLAMQGELRGTGVSVTVLCPGPIKTNWAKNAGKADSKMAQDPKEIAEMGYRALQKGELVCIPGKIYHLEKFIMNYLPYKWQVYIICKWQHSLIEKNKK